MRKRRTFNRVVDGLAKMVVETMEAEDQRRTEAVAEVSVAINKFAAASHGAPVNFAIDLIGLMCRALPQTINEEDDLRQMTDAQAALLIDIDPAIALSRLLDLVHGHAVWMSAIGAPHPDVPVALKTRPF